MPKCVNLLVCLAKDMQWAGHGGHGLRPMHEYHLMLFLSVIEVSFV